MTPGKHAREGDAAELDRRMHALRARTRREILALVWDRELAAGDIAAEFDVTAATISEHLAVLRDAGLVEMTKAGTSRRYRARPEAMAGLRGAIEGATKWETATGIPERELTAVATRPVVVASVTVPLDVATTFAAFTDAETYSRWLQVPVSIADGRFAATLEWGTEIRGRYELVVPPELIVMRWDFEDGNVPVPGDEVTGYLRVQADPVGSRVTVHQVVDTAEQASFMEAAWGMVLGRFASNAVEATGPAAVPRPRPRRPKRGPARA